MVKWEYQIVDVDDKLAEEVEVLLNAEGINGWEAIDSPDLKNKKSIVMKRRLS